jgi:hypothetical protein
MKWHLYLLLGLGAQFVFAAEAPAKKAGSDYLRFHDHIRGAALQVGIITLQHKESGAKVDLVGAVHIGDAKYYRALNKDFKKYDSVLYEMVKPKDLDPGKLNQGRKQSSVSFLQRFMKTQLDLAYQLDEVDYGPKNFVHADMTDKQFAERQKVRGEGMFQLMMRMMREDMARQKGDKGAADISVGELMRALFSPSRAVDLKYLLARQFNELERLTAGLDGKEGSVILTERNTVALNVLAKELKAGRKNLAIFYGAAHMPDIEKRMVEKMGFERKGTRWLTAWDLPPRRK